MPTKSRIYRSFLAAFTVLAFAPGCERGIILRGDVGLELNHAPPVPGPCGHHGCSSHGGGHHGHHGFAKGPTWKAQPYRHPKFHALPIGPVFDPQVQQAAFVEQIGPEMGSSSRQPYQQPQVAPQRPESEMWIDPPEDPTYELPEPEMSSSRDSNERIEDVQGPQLQASGYHEEPPTTITRASTSSDGVRWTRPRTQVRQPSPAPGRFYPAQQRTHHWSPTR